MRSCKTVTATDGTVMRVQGDLTQESIDALAALMHKIVDKQCRHESPYPMPAVAQRLHGRRHYECGLDIGHEGLHAWSSNLRWE